MVKIVTGICTFEVRTLTVVNRPVVNRLIDGTEEKLILTSLRLGDPIKEEVFFPYWFEVSGQIGVEFQK